MHRIICEKNAFIVKYKENVKTNKFNLMKTHCIPFDS